MNTQSTSNFFEGIILNAVDCTIGLYRVKYWYMVYQKKIEKVDFLYSTIGKLLQPEDKVWVEDDGKIRVIKKKR